jgi:hypothetical protein
MAVTSTWKIPVFVAKVVKLAEERLEMVGLFVQGEAVSRCVVGKYPKGSGRIGGRLRASITYATSKNHSEVRGEGYPQASDKDGLKKSKAQTVRVGTNVEYAPYVELGLGGNGDNARFLRDSVDQNTEKIKQLLNLQKSGGL